MALTTNILGYYKFDNNSNDATGNGNNGTDTNITYSSGIINNGANFDGTSSHIEVGSGFNTKGGDMTINVWTNLINYADYRTIMAKVDASTNYNWQFYIQVGTGKLSYFDGSAEHNTTSVITLNTLQMLTFVFTNAGSFTPYINGSAGTALTGLAYGSGNSSAAVHIGIPTTTVQQVWNGQLDEMGIWSRALTGSEITQLYNSGAGLTYPFGATTASLPFKSLLGVGI